MKKTNKKGFTIVELVIVIAVIAILAAVLIPTFAGVVERANKAAAKEVARNAYTEALLVGEGDITSLDADDWTSVKAAVGATAVTYTAKAGETPATLAVTANGYTVTYTFATAGTTISDAEPANNG